MQGKKKIDPKDKENKGKQVYRGKNRGNYDCSYIDLALKMRQFTFYAKSTHTSRNS